MSLTGTLREIESENRILKFCAQSGNQITCLGLTWALREIESENQMFKFCEQNGNHAGEI